MTAHSKLTPRRLVMRDQEQTPSRPDFFRVMEPRKIYRGGTSSVGFEPKPRDLISCSVARPSPESQTRRTRMLYSYAVKKLIRQSFENVNKHNYDELLKAVAPNVHHRFAGTHSIGGERHDKEAMRRWLERVGSVLPNLQIKVNDIWVKGGPWHTNVFVQWDATATLLNGDSSYFNRGFHVITMRWGKVYSLDVFEDSQEVARGLAIQAESGLQEAVAEQIVS
jgi:ketosteroid isomerase-like protein